MTDTLKVCSVAIICGLICVLVKNYQTSFHIPTRIAAILIIFGMVTVFLSPLLSYLQKIMQRSLPTEYIEIMLKAMSIAYISQISSDVCRDCGESNIASGIDVIGKIEILIIGLPLIDKVITLSEELALW